MTRPNIDHIDIICDLAIATGR